MRIYAGCKDNKTIDFSASKYIIRECETRGKSHIFSKPICLMWGVVTTCTVIFICLRSQKLSFDIYILRVRNAVVRALWLVYLFTFSCLRYVQPAELKMLIGKERQLWFNEIPSFNRTDHFQLFKQDANLIIFSHCEILTLPQRVSYLNKQQANIDFHLNNKSYKINPLFVDFIKSFNTRA